MSHLCTVTTIVRDIDALAKAVAKIGWQLHQGGQVRYYRGPADQCDYIIEMTTEPRLKERYNIGLKRQEDGSYKILCDNSMCGPVRPTNELAGETPRILETLEHEYNFAVFQAEAELNAWDVQYQEEEGVQVAYVRGIEI